MKDFKTIAQDVLKGDIKGNFVLRNGEMISSDKLSYDYDAKYPIFRAFPYLLDGIRLNREGNYHMEGEHPKDVMCLKKKNGTIYEHYYPSVWDELHAKSITAEQLAKKLLECPTDAAVVIYNPDYDYEENNGLEAVAVADFQYNKEHNIIIL